MFNGFLWIFLFLGSGFGKRGANNSCSKGFWVWGLWLGFFISPCRVLIALTCTTCYVYGWKHKLDQLAEMVFAFSCNDIRYVL